MTKKLSLSMGPRFTLIVAWTSLAISLATLASTWIMTSAPQRDTFNPALDCQWTESDERVCGEYSRMIDEARERRAAKAEMDRIMNLDATERALIDAREREIEAINEQVDRELERWLKSRRAFEQPISGSE